jgi:tRNA nucleotidyltransferase (CCA-adding enzyme)
MRALYQLSYSPTLNLLHSVKKLEKNRKKSYRIFMKYSQSLLSSIISPIKIILNALISEGCTPYLVGGCVRDLIMNQPLKDLDLELHDIPFEEAQAVLSRFGTVLLVGKAFGVMRIAGHDIDWSLPRRDSLGRKPEVALDPHLGIQAACRRRDITMNAMAINLKDFLATGAISIIDPYDGLKAIAAKKLCAVDVTLFVQDPLRFFRVMHFIGRFGMQPDEELNELCARMSLQDPITQQPLALERIADEIKKLFLRSSRPSLGFRWLAQIRRLDELFPELAALCSTPQRPDYHPEGTVFEHAMQSLDAAARFNQLNLTQNNQEHFLIMLAGLCHDLGKATTTTNDLKAHGHDVAGVPLAKNLLGRMTNDQKCIAAVELLVRHHLAPFTFLAGGALPKAYKRLAYKLSPLVTMRQLGLVALADRQGRNGHSPEPLTNHIDLLHAFLAECNKAAVANGPEIPVLQGRDLIDEIKEGPRLGQLLKEAYTIQIEEGITDSSTLRKRVLRQKN